MPYSDFCTKWWATPGGGLFVLLACRPDVLQSETYTAALSKCGISLGVLTSPIRFLCDPFISDHAMVKVIVMGRGDTRTTKGKRMR